MTLADKPACSIRESALVLTPLAEKVRSGEIHHIRGMCSDHEAVERSMERRPFPGRKP